MKDHGNFVISINRFVKWLGQKVEEAGITVFTGFAASQLLLEEDRVSGVRRNLHESELQILLLDALGERRVRYGYEVCCAGQDDRLARVHLLDGNYVAAPILVDAIEADSPLTLRRRAEGRIARVSSLEDAVALGRALAEEPFFLAEALDAYARMPRPEAAGPSAARRRRIALVPVPLGATLRVAQMIEGRIHEDAPRPALHRSGSTTGRRRSMPAR